MKINSQSPKWLLLITMLITNIVVQIIYAYFKSEPIFNRLISLENLIADAIILISYIIIVITSKLTKK